MLEVFENKIDDDMIILPKIDINETFTSIKNGLIRNELIDSSTLRFYEMLSSLRGLQVIRLKQRTIAERLNCTRQNVSFYFNKLKNIGLIKIIRSNGKYNVYEINDYETFARENNQTIIKGFSQIYNFLIFNENLSANELRIYEILKSFAGRKDGIRPSLTDLCKYANIKSRTTVTSVISSLEDKKLIGHQRNQELNKGNTYNSYFINEEVEWFENYKKEKITEVI